MKSRTSRPPVHTRRTPVLHSVMIAAVLLAVCTGATQAQAQNFTPCTPGGNPPGYSEETVKVWIGSTQWTANPIYVPAGIVDEGQIEVVPRNGTLRAVTLLAGQPER